MVQPCGLKSDSHSTVWREGKGLLYLQKVRMGVGFSFLFLSVSFLSPSF